MDPFERHELSDEDLNAALREWAVPDAPPGLRTRLFPGTAAPWWRRLWTASIRIPFPVAVCLAAVVAFSAWRWVSPRVIVKTEVVRVVYRDLPDASVAPLRPVAEL